MPNFRRPAISSQQALHDDAQTSTVAAISKLLRHKTLRVTTVYLDHVDTEAVDDAFDALDSAYSG